MVRRPRKSQHLPCTHALPISATGGDTGPQPRRRHVHLVGDGDDLGRHGGGHHPLHHPRFPPHHPPPPPPRPPSPPPTRPTHSPGARPAQTTANATPAAHLPP